jgi:hypothetical protein
MFEETLVEGARDCLALLGKSGLLSEAYLAGGTALALQLGHRISVDFDFFTQKQFKPRQFSDELSRLGQFEEEQAEKGTVLGIFNGIKFSLFLYEHPISHPLQDFASVQLASIKDIAAMKVDAVSSRGLKRDFIDLYFICQCDLSLNDSLTLYEEKYRKLSSNLAHIQKSLVYFDDAEDDEMPKMLKEVSWEQVKCFFENEVKKMMA